MGLAEEKKTEAEPTESTFQIAGPDAK